MSTAIYFVNKNTGKRYKVLKLDREANMVTLQGTFGTFVEPYSKERMKRLGYTIEKVDDEPETDQGQPH